MKYLLESLQSDYIDINIRLREGEYQYDLAKAIASFQLKLHFPDVKEIIKALYGEETANDIQFVRKIQTILKKMEKSNVVRILPKKKPWELQRYALLSFKFRDSNKNLIAFATEQQIEHSVNLLLSISNSKETFILKSQSIKMGTRMLLLAIMAIAYTVTVWSLTEPIVNPVIFILAFSTAVLSSIILGKILSQINRQ